ncbi:ATP-dependent DNA helicase pif1 [Ceratobasidium theobromae]|uniref:ATP-dependent DNA helicase pif1 n=1 Tax=Ceratobasidium theobromae TaxID=1582974 RepID=A0A5N5Q9A0_9AGAM|nr:ATP-dependent DNA helicase pif1 [Ceratobasidium theobromae]
MGNVTAYFANVDAVVKMLQGELVPRKPSILPSLIAVTATGRSKLPTSHLKPLLHVRRTLIHSGLLALKHTLCHPGYVNLNIDEGAMANLPDDDIPQEILTTIREEQDEGIVARESAGYVPDHQDEGVNGGQQDKARERPYNGYMVADNIEELANDHSQTSRTSAADETHITPHELMQSAIENLKSELGQQMLQEGGYYTRHSLFARDFGQPQSGKSQEAGEYENPSTFAFPILFPYGVGGLEDDRKEPVSFVEHARWCLQYYNNRFRRHLVFIFWVLNFDQFSAILLTLTPDDLLKASEEEEKGVRSSDPRIQLLRKVVRVSLQKVMGSNASRALNRSKIWSTSLYLNPMNLWITFNPVDRHDPIFQVFTGKNIDMNNLGTVLGVSAHERALTVAEDPFAATQFFFFLANTILETLFGFKTKARAVSNTMGTLGIGHAYFGAVEAQGLGSLHLHLIMWLQNSPNAEEITFKLKSQEFREKVKAYLRANIRSQIENLTEDILVHAQHLPYLQQKQEATHCKRQAPFEISEVDEVTEDGAIRTRRLIKQLNSWCPSLFYGGWCNNDIKLVTNGSEARAIAWYITNYATKMQGHSFNHSAVLAKTYMYHQDHSNSEADPRERNRLFVFRCNMSLNREMEFSSQQAVAYIMGYGDTIMSHTYSPIYWSSVVWDLKKTFPELATGDEKIEPKNYVKKDKNFDPANDVGECTP